MATYDVNTAAITHARRLIEGRQYVLDSDWGQVQPDAEGANEETKARHAFVYGDLRRVHRSGLIACVYRASQWRHKKIELAAHGLLQELDARAGIT